MTLELKQNIWNLDKSRLGFYCVNIIESSKQHPSLAELLESDILKEKEFGDLEKFNETLEGNPNYYGAFLKNKIVESDFENLDFSGLKSKFAEYWKAQDWGVDLLIFKKNFELALLSLDEFELSNRTFFYISADEISPEKLTEPNFFSYLVCVIAIERYSNKVITLTFGSD